MSGEEKKIVLLTTLLPVSYQVSAKFNACTVVGLNGTLVEAKKLIFTVHSLNTVFQGEILDIIKFFYIIFYGYECLLHSVA